MISRSSVAGTPGPGRQGPGRPGVCAWAACSGAVGQVPSEIGDAPGGLGGDQQRPLACWAACQPQADSPIHRRPAGGPARTVAVLRYPGLRRREPGSGGADRGTRHRRRRDRGVGQLDVRLPDRGRPGHCEPEPVAAVAARGGRRAVRGRRGHLPGPRDGPVEHQLRRGRRRRRRDRHAVVRRDRRGRAGSVPQAPRGPPGEGRGRTPTRMSTTSAASRVSSPRRTSTPGGCGSSRRRASSSTPSRRTCTPAPRWVVAPATCTAPRWPAARRARSVPAWARRCRPARSR